MAFQLKTRPYKFAFTKNPIRYTFHVSNPTTPGCALQVELYKLDIDEAIPSLGPVGTLVATDTLTPNPDGSVEYYCEDLLDSILDWQLPGSEVITPVTSQICKYYIRYRQITRANTAPVWATDSAHLLVAIKGGVAKEKWDRNNFFSTYLPDKRPFLTWQPADIPVSATEPRYLSYLHIEPTTVLYLKARAVWSDGTMETVSLELPSMAVTPLLHLAVGLEQLGLAGLHPDLQLWYYDVWIQDEQDLAFAGPYRMAVDHFHYYNVFSFAYHNSLGGIDTMRVRGDYDISIVLESSEIQKATGADFGAVLPTEVAAINISKHEVYKGDAGHMYTRSIQESLQEMILSESVFRKVAGRWLRVVNLQKSQELTPTDDTKYTFPLQWRYTFENTQFTPFKVELGDGVSEEDPGEVYGTCAAPSDLAVETAETDDGLEVTLSWNAFGYAQSYEVEYKKATDPQWTSVPVIGTSLELLLEDAGDYSWRIRSVCGEGDFSPYAYGPGFTYNPAPAVCTRPSNFTVTLLSIDAINGTIRLKWNAVPGVVGYQVEWRAAGTAVWQSAGVGAIAVPLFDVVLPKDQQHEIRVRSQCNNNPDYSAYTYGPNFIPSNLVGTCSPPTGLNPSYTGQAHAVFTTVFLHFAMNWTNAANTDDYELQYRFDTETTWTVAPHVQSGVVLFLQPVPSTLKWRVRSNCTGGGFSQFVNGPDLTIN